MAIATRCELSEESRAKQAKQSKPSKASAPAPPPLPPVLRAHSASLRVSGLTLTRAEQKRAKRHKPRVTFVRCFVFCAHEHTHKRTSCVEKSRIRWHKVAQPTAFFPPKLKWENMDK